MMKNQKLQSVLVVIAVILISAGAFTYGALTAPRPVAPAATPSATPKLTKAELDSELQLELPTITGVLAAQYPKIATDYTINKGQLFNQGEWFGTTLSYHGSDTMNRDTLRVLMQKKNGIWVIRTTPPEPILSAKKYPDVPKSILKSINQPVSLP